MKKLLSNDKKQYVLLKTLEKKVAWFSTWMIHHANFIRDKNVAVKVGGHQASSASVVSILVLLYFKILDSYDRVAVKPHASPVYHSIQYLLGKQTKDNLHNFRNFGGAQAYPSRTKDQDDVDFSTGSVGLGGAMTIFASLIQDYIHDHGLAKKNIPKGRMVALFGDAELDEGNVYEALLEGAKHNIRNCWWIIDYNRQSLDAIVSDRLFEKIIDLFKLMNWRVITLKYGKEQMKLNQIPEGDKILKWINDCPNELFSALTFKGGDAWRAAILSDLGENKGVKAILKSYNDENLQALMTNLAGHDLISLDEAFMEASKDDIPTCFICYTIKGYGLPLAGHKDNHSGLINIPQFTKYQKSMNIKKGFEWEKLEGTDLTKIEFDDFILNNSFNKTIKRKFKDKNINQEKIVFEYEKDNLKISTQEAFGKVLNDLGKKNSEFSSRLLTTSPDVTVSTNLGGWVNQKEIYDRLLKKDTFKEQKVLSAQKWNFSPSGQHIELGIAENNLFLLLAAAGISDLLFGVKLIPIGTIYDTFIARGLDALNYATYVEGKFLLVGTPSGVSLSPEGGAHQSISTPLIGIGQPGIIYMEPSFADELVIMMDWAFRSILKEKGESVYLRLSTKKINQKRREINSSLEKDIIKGAYWYIPPPPRLDLIIAYTGVVVTEVIECIEQINEDGVEVGIISITSPDMLYRNWKSVSTGNEAKLSHIEEVLKGIPKNIPIITILDGHPASLSWIGSVFGHKVYALGTDKFGQSSNIEDIYEYMEISASAIMNCIAKALFYK